MIYFLYRLFGALLSFLPFRVLHALGKSAGFFAFYLYRPFRKKAMTNLSLVYGNQLSEKEKMRLARRSFQSVMITCLEFFLPQP